MSAFDPRRSLRPIAPHASPQILKWIQKVTRMDIDPECGVHYSLKDGVALCRLMAKLQPDAAISEPNDSSIAYKQVRRVRHNQRKSSVTVVGACDPCADLP